MLWPASSSSPDEREKAEGDALPVDSREQPESGYKEGGDEEVSEPALVVVRGQPAGVDLQDV